MAYQQRGRLLVPIKTQVVPIGDLGLPIGGVEGLQYPDDLPPVLAVNTMQTPAGPRILQGDSNGHLLQTLPKSTQVNLVSPRTDTSTYTSGDLQVPAFTSAWCMLRVTAISGTTPSVSLQLQNRDSQGIYNNIAGGGGGATGSLTAAGVAGVAFSSGINGTNNLLAPVYHAVLLVTGTGVSVSWYCDLIYK